MRKIVNKIIGRVRRIQKRNSLFTKDQLLGRGFSIGDFSYGKPSVLEFGEKTNLKIGKFCSIATNVRIFLGGNHNIDWVTTFPFSVWPEYFPGAENIPGHPYSKGDVVIGNDVWLGHSCMILSGVTIGNGAVIAAGSVVLKDVGPYEIWGGNPAQFIKKRFPNETIEMLQEVKWWDWDISFINKHVGIIFSNRISDMKHLSEEYKKFKT